MGLGPVDGASGPRNTAAPVDQGALQKAARDLEGVFLGMMFEEMAKTVGDEDGLFPESPGSDLYQGWFRGAVTAEWTKAGGAGISSAVTRSVGAPDGTLPAQGRISSEFGARVHPITGEVHNHSGVDIAVPVGTPVRSPFPGKVIGVEDHPTLGRAVTIEHSGGFRSTLAHNSEILVAPGDFVAEGMPVAKSGSTGRSTGPHVHFTLTRNGEPVDPLRYIRSASIR